MTRWIAVFFGVVLLWAMTGLAQQPEAPDDAVPDLPADADEDDGFLLTLIQDALSGPGRVVRIGEVSGVLSSQATIAEITVADADGVWLRIEDIAIDWTRRALFLRRLSVDSLTIGAIDYIRPALPPEPTGPRLADAEAQPFALPELPLQVNVQELRVDRLSLGPEVLGEAAELAATGAFTLAGGEFDTELAIRRLDGPGGTLDLIAAFSNETRQLAIDLQLEEPAGGVVANALNIEGRPAIALALQGAGPLDAVDIDFSLDADAARLAAGVVSLRSRDEGLGFLADFAGELAPLVPADYRDFFAGTTAVRVEGVNVAAGGVRLDDLAVEGAQIDITGALAVGADGFLQSLDLAGTLGDPRGDGITLPIPGARTRIHSAVMEVTYGDASRWTGLIALDRLVAGDIEIEDLTLDMGGLAENLQDPDRRNVTINVEGLATGVWSDDPDVRAALGERIDFFADAAIPPDAPVEIRQFQISGNRLSIATAGTVRDWVYSGRNTVRISDIAPFSGIAGRDLGGGVNFRALGDVLLRSGGFDLALDGVASDLRIDDQRIDPLLAGTTTITGRLARDETGFFTDDFRIANEQLSFASTGRVSSTVTDIGFEAALADLGLVAPEVGGAVSAAGRAEGVGTAVAVTLEAAIPEGTLGGRSLTGVVVRFAGDVVDGNIAGAVEGAGQLNGSAITLAADLGLVGETRSLRDLVFEVGPNRITGEIAQTGDAPIEGRLGVEAPDIAPLAALALVEAAGAATAEVTLGPAEVGQGVDVTADVRDLVWAGNRIGALDLEAEIVDALGVPLASGTLEAEDVVAAGIEITRLAAAAEQTDAERMRFTAESTLAIGTEAALAGELARLAGGFALTLERLALEQEGVAARLAAPATITLRDEEIELSPLALDLGDGRLEAVGRIAEEIDLRLVISDLPLALANSVQPALGLTGTVDGTATVTGSRDAPDVSFDLAATGVGSTAVQAAGLPLVSLTATGTTDGDLLDIDAVLSSGNGVSAAVRGTVPLGEGAMDLQIDLGALPLALIDRVAGNQGLQGTLTGQARVTGPLAAPEATFDVSGTGLSAAILRQNLVPPLALDAAGRFADNTVTITSASLTGPGGIALAASGTVPLEGPGLALTASGTVPLSLANVPLADRGAQIAGVAQVDITASGSIAAPQFAGPISIRGATFVDPRTNVRLDDIAVDAALDGTVINLSSFAARGAAGGSVTGSGTVAIDAAAGFPADLQVGLNNLRYTDGTFVSTEVSGALTITGPLTRDALVAGRLELGVTEISVAEGLGTPGALRLEQVSHLNTPRPVARTLDRARIEELRRPAPTANGLQLDVLISAPIQIFVRGRGLDVELGGELRVRGPISDIEPVGEFTLRRGRLAVLGQRIDFDEGRLRLIGNLDPDVMFVARTESNGTIAIVEVSGRVSSPEITFSSVPELPEDEVLARILFNRSADDLSPFQLAQLAAAAAELAGAGGNGLLAQLRGAAGLDDLDIVTEADGATAVRAGRYLDENIYLDVQTNTEGETRATVNLDITDRVTARGTIGTDGNSTIGIYYQRDY